MGKDKFLGKSRKQYMKLTSVNMSINFGLNPTKKSKALIKLKYGLRRLTNIGLGLGADKSVMAKNGVIKISKSS